MQKRNFDLPKEKKSLIFLISLAKIVDGASEEMRSNHNRNVFSFSIYISLCGKGRRNVCVHCDAVILPTLQTNNAGRTTKEERKSKVVKNEREKVTSMYQEWNFLWIFNQIAVFFLLVWLRSVGRWVTEPSDETRECNVNDRARTWPDRKKEIDNKKETRTRKREHDKRNSLTEVCLSNMTKEM